MCAYLVNHKILTDVGQDLLRLISYNKMGMELVLDTESLFADTLRTGQANMNSLSLSKQRLHSSLLVGASIILFVVIPISTWDLFVSPCLLNSSRPHICGPVINDLEVKITSPKDCSLNLPAGEHIPVEGTYSGNLAGREIWVLLYASSNEKYYPQSTNACKMMPVEASGGRWTTTLFDLTVEQLDVVVVAINANSEPSQIFKNWLKTTCDTRETQGIPVSSLPDGLVEMDAITVATE